MEVPKSFFELNTGVVGYLNSNEVIRMFKNASQTYNTWCDNASGNASKSMIHGEDQPAFRRAVWQSSLKLYVLGPEYNYRSILPGFLSGPVRVVHGRHDDIKEVVSKLNMGMETAHNNAHSRIFPPFPKSMYKNGWRKAN